MYFEFDDVRRIHQPYADPFFRSNIQALDHCSPCLESACLQHTEAELAKRNVRLLNRCLHRKFPSYISQAEPLNHFLNHVKILNQFYEWPKTRQEYNIFFKEVFRLPEFMPELAKK